MRLPILFDRDGAVVVDKPAGLESTGRTPDDPGGAQHHLQVQLGRRVWLVHQLDRDTSGVLVFVRRKGLVAPWQERLRAASGATKRYLAVVRGRIEGERAIRAPLAYDRSARRWAVREGGKPATTHVRALRRGDDATLVEARLETGRTHQIRVHLAHLGHPLLGDRRYADPPCERAPRQALHASRLELGDGTAFEAPLPDDLVALLARLDLEA